MIPDSARVLVDTSAWIDFFRGTDPCHTVVLRLLDEGRVCSAGIIVAELMQGAKSEKELAVLRDFIHVFDFLAESPDLWMNAGEMSFHLRKKGKTIGLADCFIAGLALRNKVAILSLDNHFAMMMPEVKPVLFPLGR